MSYARAINEIAGLLTQGGIPANHANDIAARLTYAMTSYYDQRQSSSGRADFNANSSNTAEFRNAFSTPESRSGSGINGAFGADGLGGRDGRDGAGAFAWAVGGTGAAGADGQDGQQGQAGRDGITTITNGGGGVDLSGIYKAFKDLMKRTEALENNKPPEPKPPEPKPPECCKVLGTMIKDLEKKVKAVEDKLKDTEDKLKDTVNC
jgi:hypothetical protein